MLKPFIQSLASVSRLSSGPDVAKPPQSAGHVDAEFEVYVSLQGLIDITAELKRLEKQLVEKRRHLASSQAKLDNPNFKDKAPAEVVQQQRDLVADLQKQIDVMQANAAELGKE